MAAARYFRGHLNPRGLQLTLIQCSLLSFSPFSNRLPVQIDATRQLLINNGPSFVVYFQGSISNILTSCHPFNLCTYNTIHFPHSFLT